MYDLHLINSTVKPYSNLKSRRVWFLHYLLLLAKLLNISLLLQRAFWLMFESIGFCVSPHVFNNEEGNRFWQQAIALVWYTLLILLNVIRVNFGRWDIFTWQKGTFLKFRTCEFWLLYYLLKHKQLVYIGCIDNKH